MRTVRWWWVLGAIFFFLGTRVVWAQGEIQVIIHSVNAQPQRGKVAYTVQVYLSVLDSDGSPIKDLTNEHFLLIEDSQNLPIHLVEHVSSEPIHLVMVLDTSGSMSGQPMEDARIAAEKFVEQLKPDDQVAVLAFNEKISTVASFTKNHSSVGSEIKKISAVANAGTCLYDATYQALEMASTTPSGRRAIILFTDGKDEIRNGTRCSFHQIEDVIGLANNASIPVYTLGLGKEIDESELKRLASNTGGGYLSSRNSSELDALFSRLYEQINQHYVLIYESQNTPGPHLLSVQVQYSGQKDVATARFNLPALPTSIILTSPVEGQELKGNVPFIVKVLTQSEEIARVEFAVNGVVIGTDISEPYEIEWDVSQSSPGEISIEAVAVGKNGVELARTGIKAQAVSLTPSASPKETPDQKNRELPLPKTEGGAFQLLFQNHLLFIVGAVLLLLVVSSAGFLFVQKRIKSKGKSQNKKQHAGIGSEDITIDQGIGMDNSSPSAILTVLTSNDPAMVGNQFILKKFPVMIGRDAEVADVIFSNIDRGVSRRHALIEVSGNEITIHDYNSKYGTFIRGKKIGTDPVPLKHGDEIRLGSIVRLRFEQIKPTETSGDETMDNFRALENDETQEEF